MGRHRPDFGKPAVEGDERLVERMALATHGRLRRPEYFSPRVQQLINGLTLGSIYGLIAIGYTMVYGIIGMINFAHGDIFMVGAFIALIALILVSPAARHLVGACGAADRADRRDGVHLAGTAGRSSASPTGPLRGSFRLAPLISAIGMSIVLQNFVQVAQGARVKPLPPILTGGITADGVEQRRLRRAASPTCRSSSSSTVVLLTIFTSSSPHALGRAQRACEQDRKMAALLGVDVDRTIS
jgi:branched-chain amino acid transport system permease protein